MLGSLSGYLWAHLTTKSSPLKDTTAVVHPRLLLDLAVAAVLLLLRLQLHPLVIRPLLHLAAAPPFMANVVELAGLEPLAVLQEHANILTRITLSALASCRYHFVIRIGLLVLLLKYDVRI